MRNLLGSVIFLFIFVFIIAPSALAAEYKSGESVILPKNAVIEDNYFAAGEKVTISGTVKGDLYVAGGVVNIEGTVAGDVFVAGGTVNIRGIVGEDVRVAGGQVVVSGNIEDDLTVIGGSVTITDESVVGNSLVAAGGSIQIFSPIPGSATFAAGSVEIGNSIAGDVLACVGKLTLTPSGSIAGDLTYYSENVADVPVGATVSGQIKRQAPPVEKKQIEENTKQAKNLAKGAGWTAKIVNLLSAFVLGFLALHFFPRYVSRITDRVTSTPWQSMGLGFLALIFGPVIVILFFITIIGIPIGFLFLFGYFFYMYVAKIFISLVLGKTIMNYFKWQYNNIAVLILGLFAYLILSSLPIVGGLVVFLTLITGFGAAILGKKDFYLELKSKKAI